MNTYATEIKALDPHTGEMKTWFGDNVQGISFEDAQKWCDENKGYLKVVGLLVMEIPCKENSFKPDWDNSVDYETPNLN